MTQPTTRQRPEKRNLPYMRIAIVLCPGFTLTPMASFVDALRLAADREDRSRQIYFAWEFLSITPEPVRASCGLEVGQQKALADIDGFDGLVVCGGLLSEMDGLPRSAFEPIRRAAERGIPVVGLCTGSFILGQCGLLDGRRCALHFEVLTRFQDRFPKASATSSENYIADGNIITCPGSVASIEVAAYLIRQFSAPHYAAKAYDYLLFRPGTVRLRASLGPLGEAVAKSARLTQEAVRFMEHRMDRPCEISELCASLGVSRSVLYRCFRRDLDLSPLEFWREMRLLACAELLQRGRHGVTEVAYIYGFSDVSHFCRLFKARFGLSAGRYRSTISARPAV
ncbi:GlxA family transcriptional regulator [Gellertiella hungarica]|uniref:Transcriptional regulator GlxA family with amidase domain n=1 Tax=Gellertiella hungarica TaxID=1572859 RepID=A0A7W6J7P5_9HYPH|nr:helix-turn-helix domain-containing protein [Gellertiella hungarica]MBB4066329.1 transcriptional regulator GlxA family with amidase domain [Gellertiella hungarica]